MRKIFAPMTAVFGLAAGLTWPDAAWAQATWTGTVGGATSYPTDFWESGEPAVFGEYYSPFYWPEGMNVVHTVAFNYSGSVADAGIGFQIRGQAGTTFLEPARILDDANGACPDPSVFEYSTDGVTWSSQFVPGATYILYPTNTNSFINMDPRDGTPCLIGVLATADRLTQAQTTTNADLYRLMNTTEQTLHNSSLYTYASTSESDFTPQDFALAADKQGTLAPGDSVTYTLTMSSLRYTSTLTARSHEIDLSKLLDDADIDPATIVSSTGSATLSGDKIVWASGTTIPAAAVVTVTFTATVKAGGDGDMRAVANGPTSSASWPFNLNSGPRSNCQNVAGAQGYVWANGTLMLGSDVAGLPADEFATLMGECAVVHQVGTTIVADAGGPYEIDEGAASLTLDASRTTAGPNAVYAWDLDGDGQYEDASGITPTLTAQQLAQFGLGDGPTVGTARLQVTDNATTAATATVAVAAAAWQATGETTITVHNLPPTVYLNAPEYSVVGTPVAVTLSATDPWPDDVANPQYTIDWGDGTAPETVTTGTPTHTYTTIGANTVTVTVRDKDGTESAPATATITVVTAALPSTGTGNALPIAAGSGIILLVTGTTLIAATRRRRPASSA